MTTCSPASRAARGRPLHLLADLARRIDDATAATATIPTTHPNADPVHLLVRIETDDDGVSLGFLPLDGHPLDTLTGYAAPDDWWGLGVVAGGTARSTIDSSDGRLRAVPDDPGRRARTVHLVARSGEAAALVRIGDDEPIVERFARRTRVEHLGAIDDALRRALALPTAPPPPSTLVLWATIWLDSILAGLAAGHLDGDDWSAVAHRHPLFGLIPELHADRNGLLEVQLRRWAVDHLDRAAHRFADAHPWSELLATEREGVGIGLIDRSTARWMDEGIFARELLARWPDATDLLVDLGDLLAPSVTERVTRLVRPWIAGQHAA